MLNKRSAGTKTSGLDDFKTDIQDLQQQKNVHQHQQSFEDIAGIYKTGTSDDTTNNNIIGYMNPSSIKKTPRKNSVTEKVIDVIPFPTLGNEDTKIPVGRGRGRRKNIV